MKTFKRTPSYRVPKKSVSNFFTNPVSDKIKKNSWLGKYPGKTLNRLGASLLGFWITSLGLSQLWPLPDQLGTKKSLMKLEANSNKLTR